MKWAKDLYRIRKVMKSLQDINNNIRNMDEEKLESLIRNHFVYNEVERKVEEEEEELENEEVEDRALNEMITKVKVVVSGTQNSSASSLDGITYRFINIIKDTILPEKVIKDVARNLIQRTILRQ